MQVDISSINSNLTNNILDNAKRSVSEDGFELRLKSAMRSNNEQELKKVCNEFESIMMNLMYKQMKATVPSIDLLGRDSGKELFESMLDEELMGKASEGKGIGLGEMLFKQMKKSLSISQKYDIAQSNAGNLAGGEQK